jgi:hypothetical protein
MKLNPYKWQTFQKKVHCLGHAVLPQGVATDPEKLEAVKFFPRLKEKNGLRRFLEFRTF